jgi:hypothetical protein
MTTILPDDAYARRTKNPWLARILSILYLFRASCLQGLIWMFKFEDFFDNILVECCCHVMGASLTIWILSTRASCFLACAAESIAGDFAWTTQLGLRLQWWRLNTTTCLPHSFYQTLANKHWAPKNLIQNVKQSSYEVIWYYSCRF